MDKQLLEQDFYRWVKASKRLPDTVECELVYREKDGNMFVLYVTWDMKLKADNYFYEWLEKVEAGATVKNLEREVERLKEVIKELYYCPAIKNAMKVFSMNIDDEYNKFKTENNL